HPLPGPAGLVHDRRNERVLADVGGSRRRRGRGRQRRLRLREQHHLPRHHRRQQRRPLSGRLRPVQRARQLDRVTTHGERARGQKFLRALPVLGQTSMPPRLIVRSRWREQFTITYGDPYGRATGVEIRTPSPYAYKQTSASDLPGGQPTVDILDLDAGQL